LETESGRNGEAENGRRAEGAVLEESCAGRDALRAWKGAALEEGDSSSACGGLRRRPEWNEGMTKPVYV